MKDKLDNPRIGLFNDVFPPIMDGVAVCVENYAHWLYHKTGQVSVITPQAPNHIYDHPYEVLPYFSLPVPQRKPYRMGLPRLDRHFQQTVRRRDFGLVHAHCPFSSGKVARRIARRQQIPLIATFHSKYRDDFRQSIPSDRVVNHIIKNVVSFFEAADEVWVPQAAVADVLTSYGYKGAIEVVPNGSDLKIADADYQQVHTAARAELGIAPEEPLFLFVGQHILQKNLPFLIEALSLIKDIPFQMRFVGTGYAEEQLKAQVTRLGLQNKVKFMGPIYVREDLKTYYAAADLFLFPSRYDNAPLVMREAAAMHTPSVLLAGSTTADIVTDGIDAFVATDDLRAFASRIEEVAQDFQLMATVGAKASHTLVRSWEDISTEVIDRYNHVIHRKNPGAQLIIPHGANNK